MRLFIAVSVPEEVKQHAQAVRDRLRGGMDVKWVEYHNYHLTLKFLGEVPVSNLNPIKQQLVAVGQEADPFELTPGPIGFFPNRNRPRVIFLDIQGELAKIRRLAERIDSRLSSLGFEPDQHRRFHLTLGRFRSDRGSSQSMDLPDAAIFHHSFRVDKFYLMESKLSNKGPEYQVLQVISLSEGEIK